MKTVAIIAGGRSPEHEISVISARNIYNAIDANLFKVEVIGISKKGEWYYLPEKSLFETTLEIGAHTEHIPLVLMPFNKQPLRYAKDVNKAIDIDVFFPITHGVYGEDGIIQGVLEYLNKPYVGPGVLGSAVGMDKDVTKQILQQNGIAVTPWYTYFKGDTINFEQLETLGYPLFVKPANMGSGVGVEKADNRAELEAAIANAFKFDIKLLIEKGIKGREVETAVMGNLQPKVTGVGEIIVNSGFYTYENKYVNNETKVVIPAENLSASTIATITQTATIPRCEHSDRRFFRPAVQAHHFGGAHFAPGRGCGTRPAPQTAGRIRGPGQDPRAAGNLHQRRQDARRGAGPRAAVRPARFGQDHAESHRGR